jgi:hypothetical protein
MFLPAGVVVKTVGRKEHVLDETIIKHLHQHSGLKRVSGKPVGMPRQQAFGGPFRRVLVAEAFQQFLKNLPLVRFPRTFALSEFCNDFQSEPFSDTFTVAPLIGYGTDLSFGTFLCRFSKVQKHLGGLWSVFGKHSMLFKK